MSDSLMKALETRYEQGRAIHPATWPTLSSAIQTEGTARQGFPQAVLKHLREVPTYQADGDGGLVIVYIVGRASLTLWHKDMEDAENLMYEMQNFIESAALTIRDDIHPHLEREDYYLTDVPAGKRGVQGEYVYMAVTKWRVMFSPP
jgi:hypothetical protein